MPKSSWKKYIHIYCNIECDSSVSDNIPVGSSSNNIDLIQSHESAIKKLPYISADRYVIIQTGSSAKSCKPLTMILFLNKLSHANLIFLYVLWYFSFLPLLSASYFFKGYLPCTFVAKCKSYILLTLRSQVTIPVLL